MTDSRGSLFRGDLVRLNLHRVGLDVVSNNTRAICTYERVGFQHEGTMRDAVLRDGSRHDCILMGILRHEWQGQVPGRDSEQEAIL